MFSNPRRRVATRLAALGAAGLLLVGLAACGSSGSSGSATESGNDASADSTPGSSGSSGSATESGNDASADSTPGSSGSAASAGSDDADDSDTSTDSDATLTIYSGQHDSFAQTIADAFTNDTGITIKLRFGHDAELANQIVEEGDSSPADLFMTEEPGPIGMIDSNGLLSPVDKSTLAEVDQRLVPSTGNWMPYAARSRVIFYNPEMIKKSELPDSILDLTDPKWKGEFAYAPSGAFTSTVSYLIDDIGKAKTEAWLKGIKKNGINEQSNGKVRDSVEAGQHAFGISNHYYWYFMAEDKGGPDNVTSKVYYFDHPDAGGLLLASGAGILKSSDHQAEAQQFLAWLGSADEGQKVVAGATAAQYPVAPGVQSSDGLPPLASLHPPRVDQSVFADTTEAKDLILAAGIA